MPQWLRELSAFPEDLSFGFQHSHGSSQPSLTPLPGVLMSNATRGAQTYMEATTHLHKKRIVWKRAPNC